MWVVRQKSICTNPTHLGSLELLNPPAFGLRTGESGDIYRVILRSQGTVRVDSTGVVVRRAPTSAKDIRSLLNFDADTWIKTLTNDRLDLSMVNRCNVLVPIEYSGRVRQQDEAVGFEPLRLRPTGLLQ